MENARERSSERELLSSSQDVVIREISSVDPIVTSPDESAKQKEKKVQHAPSRSSIVPASHHRSSHAVDRHGQSSSAGGALDLQSLVRSGSSSSLSGITVPIRLDALSYLLNNAVLGASKVPSQTPSYPPMCPGCPYTQMGYPYGAYMGSPYNMPYMNQFPACQQPGLMSCGTPQGVQACPNPMPNFSQFMVGPTPGQNQSTFSSVMPPTGTFLTTSTMNMATQSGQGNAQADSNTWGQKANEGFGNNKSNNPFSSNFEKQTSPSPQQGYPRFGEKQSEDGWFGRASNNSYRGSGRGRGDFGGRSWQNNSTGQDRRFGDRSWNTNNGGRRRFQESPDRNQDRGGSFKRGRWQDGRGRGGDNRDGWQQRNRQSFSPPWSNAGSSQGGFKANEEEKVVSKTEESNDKDEDWEMEYAGEPSAPETSNTSLPLTSKTGEDEDISIGSAADLAQTKEEGEVDSDKAVRETIEVKAQVQDEAQTLDPVGDTAEKPVEDGEEGTKEEVYTLILSVEGQDMGILVTGEAQE
ncbi:SR-related and CTD-associated factor 4-like [Dendropsophus ebraccatus]|uniref:SR-related and CTD-associated factor 4-like n=1 Tax=Dendropsophus ebraccatus TaxID=150705 RepID=UPI00383222E3